MQSTYTVSLAALRSVTVSTLFVFRLRCKLLMWGKYSSACLCEINRDTRRYARVQNPTSFSGLRLPNLVHILVRSVHHLALPWADILFKLLTRLRAYPGRDYNESQLVSRDVI